MSSYCSGSFSLFTLNVTRWGGAGGGGGGGLERQARIIVLTSYMINIHACLDTEIKNH